MRWFFISFCVFAVGVDSNWYLCSLCNARARRKDSENFSREEKMLFDQEIEKIPLSQENEIIIPKAKR